MRADAGGDTVKDTIAAARAEAGAAAEVATRAMGTGVRPGAGELGRARGAIEAAVRAAPDDVEVLFLAFQFHFRLGELEAAEAWCRRRAAVVKPGSADDARVCTNLGLVVLRRGEVDEAERLMARAVEVDRALGHAEGVARDLGNLALVYEARRDWERAEALTREAMAAAQEIHGTRGEELHACGVANLGDYAAVRGDMITARARWVEAEETFERLGVTKWRAELRRKIEGGGAG